MKYQPERTCVCCRQRFPQDKLIKVVRLNGEFSVDKTGKSNGRGAYCCGSEGCLKKLVKSRALDRSFKAKVPDEVYAELLKVASDGSVADN